MTATMTWAPAAGWDGLYEISESGTIRNAKTHKELRPSLNSEYPCVNLWRGGKGRTERIHVLLLRTFIRDRLSGECCNHINGVKSDNRLENLEWVTYGENNRHAIEIGLRGRTRRRFALQICCNRGHPYVMAPSGRRYCKECEHVRSAAYRARLKTKGLDEQGAPCECRR